MARAPGLLRADVNPDVRMMICTAGHVDHGKTSLVKMLTGCNTDRLKAEQERGLTIELGFAPCMLGGELCVGIVDVPGHEKFVRNMVAGVSGIDMALLVVAADDGIMPQTIEHFQILELLGIRHGLVALTKIDLVDEDRVKEVLEDLQIFADSTFLEGAPICPVSSVTGEGFFDFYEVLVKCIKGIERAQRLGVFRMPVERVFVQKGFGVVVTGIPVDGHVAVGDELEIVPGGHRGHVRGVQRFLRDADEGGYGQCLALNMPDFTRTPPERGQVLAAPGYVKSAFCLHVRLATVFNIDRPLRNAESVKIHTGTSEASGKLYLLEEEVIGRKETALASLVSNEPLAAVPCDRFIIRRPSPAHTVAGGEILDVSSENQRPRKKVVLAQLQKRIEALGQLDPVSQEGRDARVGYWLAAQAPVVAGLRETATGTLLPEEVAAGSIQRLVDAGTLIELGGERFVHRERYQGCLDEIGHRLEGEQAAGRLTLTQGALRGGLPWPGVLWNRVLQDLEASGQVIIRGNKVVLRAAVAGLGKADQALMEQILQAYEKSGFQSPRPDELGELLAAPFPRIEKLLKLLYDQGLLIRLTKNVVISYNWVKEAQDRAVRIIQEKGSLDSADFKYAIDSSRKYALAILDYLDSIRVTVRIENDRKLASDYERNLI